jgi:hypothetical protein
MTDTFFKDKCGNRGRLSPMINRETDGDCREEEEAVGVLIERRMFGV